MKCNDLSNLYKNWHMADKSFWIGPLHTRSFSFKWKCLTIQYFRRAKHQILNKALGDCSQNNTKTLWSFWQQSPRIELLSISLMEHIRKYMTDDCRRSKALNRHFAIKYSSILYSFQFISFINIQFLTYLRLMLC